LHISGGSADRRISHVGIKFTVQYLSRINIISKITTSVTMLSAWHYEIKRQEIADRSFAWPCWRGRAGFFSDNVQTGLRKSRFSVSLHRARFESRNLRAGGRPAATPAGIPMRFNHKSTAGRSANSCRRCPGTSCRCLSLRSNRANRSSRRCPAGLPPVAKAKGSSICCRGR
jgi:hypothetical protein